MSAFDSIDEEQLAGMASKIGLEDGMRILSIAKQTFLDPKLIGVKERAESNPDTREVREMFESMSEEEKEQAMYDAIYDIVGVLAEIRERVETNPDQAPLGEFEAMIRDPYTIEALLLILEDPRMDYETIQIKKDFVAEHLRIIGVMVLPEMYSQAEVQEVLDKLGYQSDGRLDIQ